ncbi:MAG: glucose-6-phosphate dehydrogenase assembly protein OpcA [Planctomycetota bacterium]
MSATLVRTPPQATTLKQIPDALAKLWRACLPDEQCLPGGQGGDVSRALTINFVGIAEASDEQALRAAVERLQRRSPCRAFLLFVNAPGKEVAAEISATTRGQGATRDIVLEEIVIRVPQGGFEQIPGLLRPLLVNDLPNHLYWGLGWPKDEGQFDELSGLCDHTVVDTAHFATPAKNLPLLQQRRAQGARLTDLSWLRLRPWRRALAEAFERVPWQKGSSTTCAIRHGKHGEAAARLLGDWLTERLGAKLKLEADGKEGGTGPVHVKLLTGGFELELSVAQQQVVAHLTTPEHCYLPFKVPTPRSSDGDLLAAAIDMDS